MLRRLASVRGRVCAAGLAVLASATVSMAQYTPPAFGDINVPIDSSDVATKVLAAGGILLAIALAVTAGFRLANRFGNKLAGKM